MDLRTVAGAGRIRRGGGLVRSLEERSSEAEMKIFNRGAVRRYGTVLVATYLLRAATAASFVTFESGQVRPLALSPGLARPASFGKLCHTSCGAAIQACIDAGTAHCRRDVVRRCRQEGVQVCMSCDTVLTTPTSSALAKLCRTTCGAAIDQCTKSGGTRCRRETIRDCRQSGLDTCLVCTTTTTTTFPGSRPGPTLPPGVTTTTSPDCNTVKVTVDRGDCGPISSDPPGVFNCSGACTSKTFTISAAADNPTLIGTPKNGDTDVSWDGDCYDDGTVPLEFAFLPNCTLSCTCSSVQ